MLARHELAAGRDRAHISVADAVVYIATEEAGLQIVDLSDPVTPAVLDNPVIGTVNRVLTDGAIIYMAGSGQPIHIFDSASPDRLRWLADLETRGPVLDLVLTDTHLIVTDTLGMAIYPRARISALP